MGAEGNEDIEEGRIPVRTRRETVPYENLLLVGRQRYVAARAVNEMAACLDI